MDKSENFVETSQKPVVASFGNNWALDSTMANG